MPNTKYQGRSTKYKALKCRGRRPSQSPASFSTCLTKKGGQVRARVYSSTHSLAIIPGVKFYCFFVLSFGAFVTIGPVTQSLGWERGPPRPPSPALGAKCERALNLRIGGKTTRASGRRRARAPAFPAYELNKVSKPDLTSDQTLACGNKQNRV
jgi:hypothetical protein